MKSEKVKEIKKALEDNAAYEHYNKLGYIDDYKCKTVAYADILTLINELESENYKLKQHKRELEGGQRDLLKVIKEFDKETQQLKDRLAELEKEVETRKEEVLHLQEYGKKLIRETELKQFAERLKERSFYIETIENNYNVVELSTVDAILREYEK